MPKLIIQLYLFAFSLFTFSPLLSLPNAEQYLAKADSLDDLGLYQEAMQQLHIVRYRFPEASFCDYGELLGNLYNRLYQYDSAQWTYQSVLENCDAPSKIYSAMHGLAFMYRMQGVIDSSAIWEYKALTSAETYDDNAGINLSLQSLAILDYVRKDFRKSISQAKKLIQRLDPEKSLSLAGNMYNLLGVDYRKLDVLDSALMFHQKALEVRRQAGNESRIASSLNNIAAIHLTQEDGKSSLPLLLEALEIKKKRKDSSSLVTIFSNIGNAYYFEGKVKRARTNYQLAADIAEKINFPEGQFENLKSIINLDSLTGNYKQALQHLADYLELSEKYLSEQKEKEILALQEQYEAQKKELEIAEQNQELAQQRKTITAVIIVGVLFAGLALFLFFLFRKNKLLSARNQLLVQEQNHRVKNNLQMISSMLSLQTQDIQAPDAKSALQDSQSRVNSVALLHRMLYEGEQIGKINVKEYLSTLVDEIRHTGNSQVTIQLQVEEDPVLPIERATSLGLIINELCTNSFKHANTSATLEINIVLEITTDKKLRMVYHDNGPGVEPAIWKQSKSFGNKLIRIQTNQINGSFDLNSEDGFCFTLHASA
ncbi:MAG: tetratricopeptide repeat protein [Cyclobacteriaceae bacterium]|nr:tetratricopeptide repeat protein [Cyclobacteriaceae bacterium HetDA_MAG_MS6]